MGALEDLEKSVALDDQEVMATEKGTNVLEQLPEEELSKFPAGDVKVPYPDSDWLEGFLIKMLGRQPDPERVKEVLSQMKDQPDTWSGAAEKGWPKGAPVKGQDANIPTWMKFLRTPDAPASVLFQPSDEDFLRYQGIETRPPTYLEEILNESKIDIQYLKQIESITPGILDATIGNNLAYAYNEANGTEYMPKDFQIAFTDDGVPTFVDPGTKQRTTFNKYVPEWNDLMQYQAQMIPMMYMMGGTVVAGGLTIATGGVAGGPATIITEGLAAYLGAQKMRHIAYEKAGWRKLTNGWVNPKAKGVTNDMMHSSDLPEGLVDDPQSFVADTEIMVESIPDGLWGLGGSAVFRGLFHMGKIANAQVIANTLNIPITKSMLLKGAVNEEDFLMAVQKYGKNALGQELDLFAETGLSAGQMYKLHAEDLFTQAKALLQSTDANELADGKALQKQAISVQQTANKLLKQEAAFVHGDPSSRLGNLKAEQEYFINSNFTDKTLAKNIDWERIGDPQYLDELGLSIDEAWTGYHNQQIKERFINLFATQNNLRTQYDEIFKTSTSLEEAMQKIQKLNKSIKDDMFKQNDELYNTIGAALNNKIKAKKLGTTRIFDLKTPALINSLKKANRKIDSDIFHMAGKSQSEKELLRTVKKVLTDANKSTLSYDEIHSAIKSLRSFRSNGKLGKEYDDVILSLEKIRNSGLKKFDKEHGTSYASQILEAEATHQSLNNFWFKGAIAKMMEMNPGSTGGFVMDDPMKIFQALLPKNATKDHVQNLSTIFKHTTSAASGTSENIVNGSVVKNVLIDGFKQAWRKSVLEPVEDTGVTVGVHMDIPVDTFTKKVFTGIKEAKPYYVIGSDGKRYRVNTVKHEKFMTENGNAAEFLLSPNELKVFGDVRKFSEQLVKEEKALQQMVNQFDKSFPWGKELSIAEFKNGHLMVNKVLESGNVNDMGQIIKAVKNYHTKNGKLSTQGQQIIDGIQDATMSNLMKKSNGRWNQTAGVWEFDPMMMDKVLTGSNNKFYAFAFGQGDFAKGIQHVNNMRTILNAMRIVKDQGIKGGEGMKAFPFFTDGNPAYEVIRWAVGVLNRRARALTGAKRVLGVSAWDSLDEALANPEAAANFIKLMHKSWTEKEAQNILGNVMGMNYDEIENYVMEGKNFYGDMVSDEVIELEKLTRESEPDKVKIEQIPKGGTIRKWADKLDTMMGFN